MNLENLETMLKNSLSVLDNKNVSITITVNLLLYESLVDTNL